MAVLVRGRASKLAWLARFCGPVTFLQPQPPRTDIVVWMRSRFQILLLAGVLALEHPLSTCGQALLDQALISDRSFIAQPSPEILAHAQTFRVGTNGLLTRFATELYVPTNASIRWEIRRILNGVPATVLALGSLSASELFLSGLSINSTNFVQFQPWYRGLPVAAGEELAVVLALPGGFGWVGEDGAGQYDPYPRGQHFMQLTNGQWIASNCVDLGFKTFVAPEEPIPVLSNVRLSGADLVFTVRCQSSYTVIVEGLRDLSSWVAVHTNKQALAMRTIQLPRDDSPRYFRARVGARLVFFGLIPSSNIDLGGATIAVDSYDGTNSVYAQTTNSVYTPRTDSVYTLP
jgi:hypothetical protein